MLAAQGIAYVHVLQPNQYYTSRPFTAEESAVAINTASPFKSGVEQGYPALLEEAAARALGHDGRRSMVQRLGPVTGMAAVQKATVTR